jgi:hypothetical protein
VRLQVENRPEGTVYIFEVDLPESTFDLDEMDQLRRDWPLPKPDLDGVIADQIEEGSILEGITFFLGTTGLEPNSLDSWYLQGVLVEAGFPVVEYSVELPGRITVHEVDGVESGLVAGNRVTLVVDEAFWHEFGPGEHRLRVETLLSVCEETCTEPHMVWDGISEYPVCSCVCELGWEMREQGCVDCQTLCQQRDPPADYDPQSSSTNQCACSAIPAPGSAAPDKQTGDIDWSFLQDLIVLAQFPVEGPTPAQAAAGAGALTVLMFFWAAVAEVDRIRRTAQAVPPVQPAQPPAQPARPPAQPAQPQPQPSQPPAQPARTSVQPPPRPAGQPPGPDPQAGEQQTVVRPPGDRTQVSPDEEAELDRFFAEYGSGESDLPDSGVKTVLDAHPGDQQLPLEPEAEGVEEQAGEEQRELTAEELAQLKEEEARSREAQRELDGQIDELLDELESGLDRDGGMMIDDDADSATEDF